jgi:metal-responsive CopG/Arc/MetJ family transcriptional regulator
MATIQIVLDSKLLKAADRVAAQAKINRSALFRNALCEHLKRLHIRELEEREELGYAKRPQQREEWEPWIRVAVWPTE